MKRLRNNDDRILAARSLRKQVKVLAEQLRGLREGGDIECIHRARVASRRLGAVLGLFRDCWKRKQVKNWKKQVRIVANDLSEARDQDVHIEFLVGSLAGVSEPALVPGIARLLSHAEQQRQWLQPRILQAVDRMDKSGVLKEMRAAVRRELDYADNIPGTLSEAMRRHAVKSVRKRLKKLLAEAPSLANPGLHERHHAMRIAAKRLRYTLELARPRESVEFDAIGDIVKRLQTMLGDVHDCDVWAENLDAFARTEAGQIRAFFGESRRFDRLLPGIDHLRNDRKSHREEVFFELGAFWHELIAKRFWDRMIALLEPGNSTAPSTNGKTAGVRTRRASKAS